MSCWIFSSVIENGSMTLVVGSAVVIIVIQVYSREIKKAQENMGLFSKMTQNNGITNWKVSSKKWNYINNNNNNNQEQSPGVDP